MRRWKAYRAATRYGQGARAGELREIGADPRDWLDRQLASDARESAAVARIGASHEHLGTVLRFSRETKRAKAAARRGAAPDAEANDILARTKRFLAQDVAPVAVAQAVARLELAATTRAPFRERLVHFWSNHFTVSAAGKPFLAASCAPFEHEVVRPHLSGHFADMLLAAEQHPTMLIYLDNHQSAGPRSVLGRRRKRGLNENLAREIMELHTLGVEGGYTQADVTSLARVITGWTVTDGRRLEGVPGTFRFVGEMHEPGPHRVLGRSYSDLGVEQGRRVLRDLARHPSTAQFIATKLARHFVADDPPGQGVEPLARTFRDTDGHLPSVHRELVRLSVAWDAEQRKLKTPHELLVSAMRGLGIARLPDRKLVQLLRLLGHFPFHAPSPAGWPDDAAHWGSPNALKRRIQWGVKTGEKVGHRRNPRALLEHMIDPVHGQSLRLAVERAASSAQGIGLLLASPDFQWR